MGDTTEKMTLLEALEICQVGWTTKDEQAVLLAARAVVNDHGRLAVLKRLTDTRQAEMAEIEARIA